MIHDHSNSHRSTKNNRQMTGSDRQQVRGNCTQNLLGHWGNREGAGSNTQFLKDKRLLHPPQGKLMTQNWVE